MNEAIERNTEALRRILMALVAMAGLGAATLPRRLHRAVLRLLRPAESAARRLIIVLARGLVVPPPSRPGATTRPLRQARQFLPKMPPEARVVSRLTLPLLDSPRRAIFSHPVRPQSLPRISVPGFTQWAALPNPLPGDPLDATHLRLRLDALGRALDDLPRQALRFKRWQSRQATQHGQPAKARLRWPLRTGRPPGSCRRSAHEVFGVLDHAHQLAWWALEQARQQRVASDTS